MMKSDRFLWVDNPPAKYIDFASEILPIMGHFIVSSIRRRNLVRRLEIMSYTDPLTGFGNRYAMENMCRDSSSDEDWRGVLRCYRSEACQ